VDNNEETIEVMVSARILRHVSRGIYRTPAAALKELVSNAYDASSSEVSISTGYPSFEKMAVTDNGDGMTRKDFSRLVQHIGLSSKSAGDLITIPGATQQRRVLGHYGIGLLAVGQLAGQMRVTSKKKGEIVGFIATLDFDQFERKLIEGVERAIIRDEAELEKEDAERPRKAISSAKPADGSEDKKFPIGNCKIKDAKFNEKDRAAHFTKIELTQIRPEVKDKLAGKLRDRNEIAKKKQRYFAQFDDILELIRDSEGDVRQGQYPYERLCWELAVYCPLIYPAVGLFSAKKSLQAFSDIAGGYSFSLVVDGMKLRKPFDKSFFVAGGSVNKVWSWLSETYSKNGTDHKVSAYLIHKGRIRPKSMQGVLIRESGVAVGLYDTTYMEYPFNEGHKFNQLSGEIFAEGLSGALNIDRNSFNETDDRYLSLSSWLHEKLQKEVFPAIKKLQKLPGSSKREANKQAIASMIIALGRLIKNKITRAQFRSAGKREPLFEVSDRILYINSDHPDGKGSSAKQEKVLLAAAAIIAGHLSADKVEKLLAQIEEAKEK